MKRTKFQAPTPPNTDEQGFIYIMEKWHSLEKDELARYIFADDSPDIQRKLRKMLEKYNNALFEGIIPLGKIISRNGNYELIRSNHELADKIRLRAKYDLLCSAIAYRNTLKILGTEQAEGQLDLFSFADKTLSELITEAQTLENDL